MSKSVFTRADLEQTVSGRKHPIPVTEGWRNGMLTVWVAGVPKNPKSLMLYGRGGSYEHTKTWRERAVTALYPWTKVAMPPTAWRATPWADWTPTMQKCVTFTVYCTLPFDEDENLPLVCSAVKDALAVPKPRQIGVGLIDDDRKSSRHTFVYVQVPSRKPGAPKGIAVTVALAREVAERP